jgi:3-hydroxybutyrate dehydrogenase
MSSESLKGRHALVTGGGRGIGLAIARTLVEAGATVTILGRNAKALERAVSDRVVHAAVVADVVNFGMVQKAVSDAVSLNGPLDLLVANAGAAVSAPFMKSTPDLFRQMIDVNLIGVTNVTQAVLSGMMERGSGRIIAIASTAGLKGYPYVSAYCAAKHAVIGFVRALAHETARSGVTVNAICPGYTDTDLIAESLDRIMTKTGRSREQALQELTKHNPQGQLIDPSEVAQTVLWLCGEGARSVTGQAIAVAGGEV